MSGALEDRRLRLSVLIGLLVVVVALLWGAMESHYRSCVSAAEARFPAVPVSALTGEETGPLKLSFVTERQQAVDGCGRLPI
jgi:hypothetical protein